MHLHQSLWSPQQHTLLQEDLAFDALQCQLVLAFSERETFEQHDYSVKIQAQFPNASVIYVSSAGQFAGVNLHANTVITTAVQLERSKVVCKTLSVQDFKDSASCAQALCEDISKQELAAVCILSEGSLVNGTELLTGVSKALAETVPIFGGLAGDGYLFERTVVGLNQAPHDGAVVAIAFYGQDLGFGFGSQGGWMPYGPERRVSHSQKNVLQKIADQPALDIYKEYLGKYALELPAMALYFPLSIRKDFDSASVVRTILSINEADKSMTFAGNIPEGYLVRMMSARADDLIDAATLAAKQASAPRQNSRSLALVVSCVGRKMVLTDRVEEELEASLLQLGDKTMQAGFYAYGEISPKSSGGGGDLHNQTLTVTTIWERE